MDKELIYREDALRCEEQSHYAYVSLRGMLKTIPAVDAIEVRHGIWSKNNHIYQTGIYCSICDKRSLARTNYCPNCGAKMDGDLDG